MSSTEIVPTVRSQSPPAGPSRAPTMPEIRAVLDQARAMEGQEDTQDFAVEAPRVIARLVQILDLYVGHEPTLAEEDAFVRGELLRTRHVIADALRLLESAPEAFLATTSNSIHAAACVLRDAHNTTGAIA